MISFIILTIVLFLLGWGLLYLVTLRESYTISQEDQDEIRAAQEKDPRL